MDISPRTSRSHSTTYIPHRPASPTIEEEGPESLSPAQQQGLPRSPSSTSSDSEITEDCGQPLNPIGFGSQKKQATRPVARATSRDETPNQAHPKGEAIQMEMGRRRSTYYETAFAHREAPGSASERVNRDSVVMAEIRTNVIVSYLLDLLY
jgi:hypothetical protein